MTGGSSSTKRASLGQVARSAARASRSTRAGSRRRRRRRGRSPRRRRGRAPSWSASRSCRASCATRMRARSTFSLARIASRAGGSQTSVLAASVTRGLRGRVERLDREDEVAVELDARGLVAAGRPHVEERAAHRERARVLDDGNAQVARLGERARRAARDRGRRRPGPCACARERPRAGRPCVRAPAAGTTSTRNGRSRARCPSVAMRLSAERRSGFTSAYGDDSEVVRTSTRSPSLISSSPSSPGPSRNCTSLARARAVSPSAVTATTGALPVRASPAMTTASAQPRTPAMSTRALVSARAAISDRRVTTTPSGGSTDGSAAARSSSSTDLF